MMLDDQNELTTNLELIDDTIQGEEFELFKKLFHNKTIIYDSILSKAGHQRLVIIDDEYVNMLTLDKMYSFKESKPISKSNMKIFSSLGLKSDNAK